MFFIAQPQLTEHSLQSAEGFDVTLKLLRKVLLPPLYTLLTVHVSLPR
jgi:hypothetical protein